MPTPLAKADTALVTGAPVDIEHRCARTSIADHSPQPAENPEDIIMSIQSVAGTAIKISAGVPATFDSAGYSALTYTTVGEITDLGEFGRVYNVIKHNYIGFARTSKRKGSYGRGALNLKLALDSGDAGQDPVQGGNAASDANYAVLITAQGGDKYYTCKCRSRPSKPCSQRGQHEVRQHRHGNPASAVRRWRGRSAGPLINSGAGTGVTYDIVIVGV